MLQRSSQATPKYGADMVGACCRQQAQRLTDTVVPGSVWFYQPNKYAPPVFAALFLVSACIHAYQS